ncbi:MAG: CHAT domain-containing protein [Saprospiraceae bacterium]
MNPKHGRIGYLHILDLNSSFLFGFIVIAFISCTTEKADTLDVFYQSYLTQDIDKINLAYISVTESRDSNHIKAANTLIDISHGNLDLNHTIKDQSNIWYRILEGKKQYYKGNIEATVSLLYDDYRNLDQLKWYEKFEVSITYLLAARHSAQNKTEVLNQTFDYSRHIDFDNKVIPSYQLLNLAFHAEGLYRLGFVKESLALIMMVQETSLTDDHSPMLIATIQGIFTTILIQEQNDDAAIPQVLSLIDYCKHYKSLKPIYSNVLSNYAFILSKSEYFQDSIDRIHDRAVDVSNNIPISNIYVRTNMAYAAMRNNDFDRALTYINQAVGNLDLTSCNRIRDYALYTQTVVSKHVNKKLYTEKLMTLLKLDCLTDEVKALVNLDLAQMSLEQPDSGVNKPLFYIDNYMSLMDKILLNQKSVHVSDIIFNGIKLKLKYLFGRLYEQGLSKSSIALEILTTIENSKNRSINNVKRKTLREKNKIEDYVDSMISRFIDAYMLGLSHNNHNHNELYALIEGNYIKIQSNSDKKKVIKYSDLTESQSQQPLDDMDSTSQYLSYFLADGHYYVVSGTVDSIAVYRIETDDVNKLLLQGYNCLSQIPDQGNNCDQYLESIYDIVLRDYLIQDKTKLLISADNILSFLPFGTLIQSHNNRYLIEDFDISYVSSVSAVTASAYRARANNNKSLLLSYSNAETINSLELKTIPELHYAPQECRAVKSAVDHTNLDVYTGTDMTINKIDALSSYDLIHIISHSSSSPTTLKDNYILFRDSDGKPVKYYTYLLNGTTINASLVVLSSCETGIGKTLPGEGVYSISRDFLEAGAHSVIESLWKINDNATASLFSLFYQNDPNKLTVTHFNKAKRDFIKAKENTIESHPYYWGGLIFKK